MSIIFRVDGWALEISASRRGYDEAAPTDLWRRLADGPVWEVKPEHFRMSETARVLSSHPMLTGPDPYEVRHDQG